MSFIEQLHRIDNRPDGYYQQPFMVQLAQARRSVSKRSNLEVVSDWLHDNRSRFAYVSTSKARNPDYQLISAPSDGSCVGIVLETECSHAMRGLFAVFTRSFEIIADETGQLPQTLRDSLRQAGYLRHEKDRLTCSIPEGLVAMVPPSAGSSARRAVGIRTSLLADHPPL